MSCFDATKAYKCRNTVLLDRKAQEAPLRHVSRQREGLFSPYWRISRQRGPICSVTACFKATEYLFSPFWCLLWQRKANLLRTGVFRGNDGLFAPLRPVSRQPNAFCSVTALFAATTCAARDQSRSHVLIIEKNWLNGSAVIDARLGI